MSCRFQSFKIVTSMFRISSSLLFVALTACSSHQLIDTATMLGAENAEGSQPYYGTPKTGPEVWARNLELTIDNPAENSQISSQRLVLSGRCSYEGALILISLRDIQIGTGLCHQGRWISGKISSDQLPSGHFQIFAKMKLPQGDTISTQRSFRN